MPARNTIKQYVSQGYYHLYNRGVEKRLIFVDKQDYAVCLGYLNEYLMPKDENAMRKILADPSTSYKNKDKIIKLLRLNNFAHEVTLIAYCLMPNHFHLLIKQNMSTSIDVFMQSLWTRYTAYFNRKYNRVGSLFQAVYKAVLIQTQEQLLHLTRYMHAQAFLQGETLQTYPVQPSSYLEYVGKMTTQWVHPEEILSYFSDTNALLSYESFVRQSNDITLPQALVIENES